VWSDLAAPRDSSGKDEAKKFFQMFTKAFSDVKVSIDGIWAVGDYVVAESTTSGNHTGQLGPLKPTKKAVSMHSLDILQMKDGKIVRGTSYDNSGEVLDRRGLLPKPKPPNPDARARGRNKSKRAEKGAAPAKAAAPAKTEAKDATKADKPKPAAATPAAATPAA